VIEIIKKAQLKNVLTVFQFPKVLLFYY